MGACVVYTRNLLLQTHEANNQRIQTSFGILMGIYYLYGEG